MLVDFILASVHHIVAFSLVACLAIEFALVRPGLRATDLPRLGRVDSAYGGLALAIIVVGIGRVLFGLKGWEYYVYYPVFWAKMAAFIIVGLLSVPPTLKIIAWRRAAAAGMDAVLEGEIVSMRSYLRGEAAFLIVIMVLAATMARGLFY